MDSDEANQNVGTDLDSNCLTLKVFLKKNFQEVYFEKKSADNKKACKITQHAEKFWKPLSYLQEASESQEPFWSYFPCLYKTCWTAF